MVDGTVNEADRLAAVWYFLHIRNSENPVARRPPKKDAQPGFPFG
jgi:hypothetical protein